MVRVTKPAKMFGTSWVITLDKDDRVVLTDMYTNLPDSDDELIKTARRVTTTKKATTARRSPTRRWQW